MALILSTLATFLFVLILPDLSYAWGPATHINLGNAVLHNLPLLPANIQGILAANRYDFLYGCISADVVHGKKFIEYAKHCHNWHIGEKLLNDSKTDSQRAFSYGYLCHLAADVVAHNYFVPNQIIASFTSRLLNHTYWEIRFDSYMDKSVWDTANKVAREMHQDNDPLMRATIENTIFSFDTNKRIFNSLLMVGRLNRWHRTVDLISSRSRWILTQEEIEGYQKTALDSILEFMTEGNKARCCCADPAGRKSLAVAHRVREHLKEMKRRGKISKEDYPEIFARLRPNFRYALTGEFKHLDLHDITG